MSSAAGWGRKHYRLLWHHSCPEMYTNMKASHVPHLSPTPAPVVVLLKRRSSTKPCLEGCGRDSQLWPSVFPLLRISQAAALTASCASPPRSRKQFYSRRCGGVSPTQYILTQEILRPLQSLQETQDPTCNRGSWGTTVSRKALTGAA